MADHPLAIEDGQLEPCVVGTVADRPDDRLNLTDGEIYHQRRRVLDPGGRQAMRRLDRVAWIVVARPRVDGIQQSAHLEIGQRAHVTQ